MFFKKLEERLNILSRDTEVIKKKAEIELLEMRVTTSQRELIAD